MRRTLTLLHRWVGLTIAGFLFVSGMTGAVISWDHELDDVLNPHLMAVSSRSPPIASLELKHLIEARDPRISVTYVPLDAEAGRSLAFGVQPRVDPATGDELGRREWGAAWPITRATFVSFLYKLHYSLHLPEFWGTDRWGLWLLGGIAALWTIDCFVGFVLTLPARHADDPQRPAPVARQLARGWLTRWKPAWRVRVSGSAFRLSLDLHRASGLWLWGLVFVLAFTAFSLNLYREVFHPLMSMVSPVTPSPFDTRQPAEPHRPIAPRIDLAEAIARAQQEAQRRAWIEPAGAAAYDARYGIYSVLFFHPGDDHGAAGVGPARLYMDGSDGRLLGDRLPWTGTAADVFVQAQFPLHSGRILGLPGRILVSAMGLVVAMLSVTGVVVWHRKRRARRALAARQAMIPLRSPRAEAQSVRAAMMSRDT